MAYKELEKNITIISEKVTVLNMKFPYNAPNEI